MAVAVVVSAVLFFFGTGLEPTAAVVVIAPLPIFAVSVHVRGLAAWALGFLAFFAGTVNSWDYYLTANDVPMPFGLVICLGLSTIFALAATGFRLLILRRRPLLAAVTAPAIWAGTLFIVANTIPFGIMGTLAWSQTELPAVLQLASITGVWGIEYLALFVPAASAAIIVDNNRVSKLRTVSALGAVLVVTLGGGALRLTTAPTAPSTTIAMLARNEPEWGTDLRDPEGQTALDDYVDQISRLPDRVEYAVMPEGSFAAENDTLAEHLAPIRTAAAEYDIDIIIGAIVSDDEDDFNSAIDVTPDGQMVRYDKWHDNGPLTEGTRLVSAADNQSIGLMVCMDVNHTNPATSYAKGGTQLILVPAADEDDNGQQHARTGQIRGVEHGFSMVWSAKRGVLLTSDGYGRVIEQQWSGAHSSSAGDFTISVAEVEHGPGGTLYTAFGDWFGWLCVAISVLVIPTVAIAARNRDG